MSTPRESFIKRAINTKKNAEKSLQGFGARVRKNVEQGQRDFETGKMPYYGSINPFKK